MNSKKLIKKLSIGIVSLAMIAPFMLNGTTPTANAKSIAPLDEMDTHVSSNKVYKDTLASFRKFDTPKNDWADDYFLNHNGKFRKHSYNNKYKNDLYKSNIICELAFDLIGDNVYTKLAKNDYKQQLPALKHGLRTKKEKDFYNFLLFKNETKGIGGNGEVKFELHHARIFKLNKKQLSNIKHKYLNKHTRYKNKKHHHYLDYGFNPFTASYKEWKKVYGVNSPMLDHGDKNANKYYSHKFLRDSSLSNVLGKLNWKLRYNPGYASDCISQLGGFYGPNDDQEITRFEINFGKEQYLEMIKHANQKTIYNK